MTTSTAFQGDFFTRAITAVAILGPILLAIIAGTLPEGMRGDLIVDGHIFIAATLATALLLRSSWSRRMPLRSTAAASPRCGRKGTPTDRPISMPPWRSGRVRRASSMGAASCRETAQFPGLK